MSTLALIALTVAAICVVGILALVIDWLMHRRCAWCDNGPATLTHYLEAHTADRTGGAR